MFTRRLRHDAVAYAMSLITPRFAYADYQDTYAALQHEANTF